MNHLSAARIASFIALNRMVEDQAREDEAYRRDLEQRGKPLLSQARKLTESALVEKLQALGIAIDKASYAVVIEHALSAEEIARSMVTDEVRARFKTRFDEDWVWLALTVLWERWFPTLPNLEQLDDRIQAGYGLMNVDPAAACDKWFLAWDDFLRLFDKGNFKSMEEFDEQFRGTQFASNWTSDFEMELANAAIDDPHWHARRIQFCEEYLRRFAAESDLTTENLRRALAEATFGTGDSARGDNLFEQWLKDDPQWGWGWIGWSDNYWPVAPDPNKNLPRAEVLLKQGLAVPGVRDREDILERLAELCREQGHNDEAEKLQAQSAAVRHSVTRTGDRTLSLKTKLDFGEEGLPLEELPNLTAQIRAEHECLLESTVKPSRKKVGRNDPCPCGSGKKFKKCCGV